MGTIADKLVYLGGTKTALRDAINAVGGTLGTSDPFRSYATELYEKIFIPGLFANGEQGAWYDPSDLSTLFQDAAGTTPVTASGQPVGRMLDKSGRGNHATQTVSASRPTYQTDGTLRWLAFDGVDDSLAVPISAIDVTKNQLIVIGALRSATKPFQAFFGLTGTYMKLDMGDFGTGLRLVAYANSTAVAPQTIGLALDERAIITVTHNRAANQIALEKNGALRVVATTAGDLKNTAGISLGVDLSSGFDARFNGRVYGMVLVGAEVQSAGIASANKYMAAKSGVAL